MGPRLPGSAHPRLADVQRLQPVKPAAVADPAGRPAIFTAEWVLANAEYAAAVLTASYYDVVDLEKQLHGPKK